MKMVIALLVLFLSMKDGFAIDGVQKYEDYLNSLKTLSGNFMQINSKGERARGTIQMDRPGKMRLTYTNPSNLLIIADGKWLITKDVQADEVNYISLENTPASFILRPYISFSGDVAITNIIPKGNNMTEISLIRRDDPDTGYITLVFRENPIALKEWKVLDAQGIETRVVLSDVESNIPLQEGLFNIESPTLMQQIF